MSAVEQLRRNDPAGTRIRIRLREYEPSEEALARALEQNSFVTDITLDVDGVQRSDWDSLLRVIATRANLERVYLQKTRAKQSICRLGTRILASDTTEQFRSIHGVAVVTSSHLIYLHFWTPHLQYHRSVFMAVSWKPPSGNKEQEVSRRHFSATKTFSP